MVFDRFKAWRKQEEVGVECPLCQQRNPEGTESCSRCSYQLQKASHQQESTIDDEVATDLFDELLEQMEEDDSDEIIDWSKASFTMDDMTIEVKQYGKDDVVLTNQKPSFAMTVDHPEPSDEEDVEYELKPGDAPEFVTKFEVPEIEPEPIEAIQTQQIELVQPTADAPETVEVISASEIPDTNGEMAEVQGSEPAPEPEPEVEPEADSGLSNMTVDTLKKMARERGLTGFSKLNKSDLITLLEAEPEEAPGEVEIPPPPTDLPPPLMPPAPPSPPEVDEDQEPMPIPPPPVIPPISAKAPEPDNYWPWAQQDMWSDRKVALRVKAAMEAARSRDIAQSTVIIDEVGPHLGDRPKLVYPVGALLQRIGRSNAVDALLKSAQKELPSDPNVATAKAKLRP
ncbi:MAG: hypothetical protein CXX69_04380 [Candidatus Thalassarchaeum betae]|jgi:hypothetical protein|uniref:Rho termination factor-like N-terminal domain-containing protein n=1 Tax=Candidatus Thalassarchaeum betae TaxID=2599289 RepID=A0A2V3HQN3_9ARCH|nr:MAG: hypothetical protein CXX69_04380 [Candidatus Thalassoarchaea betae]PXF24670.1 MAG: hypothetical protein CXX70_11000 [Euryarchaeota archaeon]HIC50136.1 hypothetical protein [Candidatus Poseidoniales archaeon]HIM13435.1 hypothetical protein [Candidatus Poseidoniales archaeon]HIM92996.1 hypothetical protein [Candidatus Poseidoniales archaeon]